VNFEVSLEALVIFPSERLPTRVTDQERGGDQKKQGGRAINEGLVAHECRARRGGLPEGATSDKGVGVVLLVKRLITTVEAPGNEGG